MNTTFEEELEKHGCFTYKNKGTSMMPLLRENKDLFTIVKKQGRCKKYDAILFKRDNKTYVLHRILKVKPDGYVVCGDHQVNPEYNIKDDQILGVMTQIHRGKKDIAVTDWQYKIYVHLWCDLFFVRATILKTKIFLRRIKGKVILKKEK